MAKKTVTMKKGTAQINVDESRLKHYETLGYELANTKSSAIKTGKGKNDADNKE